MGELVIGEYYLESILARVDEIKEKAVTGEKNILIIYCSDKNVSKISGQNKRNKTRILSEIRDFGFVDIKIIGKSGFDDETIIFDCEIIR